jgi:hypothetical protein
MEGTRLLGGVTVTIARDKDKNIEGMSWGGVE